MKISMTLQSPRVRGLISIPLLACLALHIATGGDRDVSAASQSTTRCITTLLGTQGSAASICRDSRGDAKRVLGEKSSLSVLGSRGNTSSLTVFGYVQAP